MKIYVAAKFEDISKVHTLYEILQTYGHKITHDWTNSDCQGDSSKLMEAAMQDHKGISDADVVVFIPPGGSGAHVELGISLGLHKYVMVWGELPPKAFYHHPFVFTFKTPSLLMEGLQLLEKGVMSKIFTSPEE